MTSRLLFDTGKVQLLRTDVGEPRSPSGHQYRLVLPQPFCDIPPANEVAAAWAELDGLELAEVLGLLADAYLKDITGDG